MKFRGKRIDDNEWIEGFYVYSKGMNRHYIITQGSVTNYARVEFINVHPESVGMSTLQKDKNSVEIFGSIFIGCKMSMGGDKMTFQKIKGNVNFVNGSFILQEFQPYNDYDMYECSIKAFIEETPNEIEVIGKQYER